MKLRLKPDEIIDEAYETDTPAKRTPAKAVPTPLTKNLSVRVIQVAKNPRFVYADLAGNRIAVAVPPKIAAKLAGKLINVIANDGADETTYTYQP